MGEVLQFGAGNFLRAFADLFMDEAGKGGADIGPVTIIQSTGQRAGRGDFPGSRGVSRRPARIARRDGRRRSACGRHRRGGAERQHRLAERARQGIGPGGNACDLEHDGSRLVAGGRGHFRRRARHARFREIDAIAV